MFSARKPAESHPRLRLRLRCGSLRLTLAGLLALIAATTLVYQQELPDSRWLAPPMALLAANLLCAIVSTPKFRVQGPLLVFHLALLAMLVLAAAGQLSRLSGSVELTDGVPFSGRLDRERRGPLHVGRLEDVRFVSEGFTVNYAPGPRREDTRNTVSWIDSAGRARRDIVGDDTPLVMDGYRFYTTFNKGFAPTFEWRPRAGEAVLAAVHLPAYPSEDFNQARNWTPPGGRTELWFLLDIDETLLDPATHSALRVPENYRLTLRHGEARHQLRAGEQIELPDGELRFLGLRAWMGYQVFYDWTMHWLLASGAVAVGALGLHFWRRFAAKPWDA